MEQSTLTTKRLTLRPFRMSDAPDVKRLAGDKAISDTTLNVPHPYEDGMAEAWIGTHASRYRSGEMAAFAVVENASNDLLGVVSITISQQFKRAELAYWIGVPYWGRGYCTEAVSRLIEFTFSSLDIHRITAYHLASNPASGRVMEKIGMTKEGVMREYAYQKGKFEDLVVYGIVASDL